MGNASTASEGEKEMVTETVSAVRRQKKATAGVTTGAAPVAEQEDDADLRDLLHHIRRLDDRFEY